MRIQTADEMIVNNRLTQVGSKFKTQKNGRHNAVFECSCGAIKIINVSQVKSGKTKSCGCWNHEVLLTRSTTHGSASIGKHTSTYKSWRSMRSRVSAKPGTHHGKRYAERGITICDEWNDFSVFLKDMGERPDGTTIERKNNSKGYSKSNCVWATKAEQARNTSRTVTVAVNGKSMCMLDAARECGIKMATLRFRLNAGWPVEKALKTAVR